MRFHYFLQVSGKVPVLLESKCLLSWKLFVYEELAKLDFLQSWIRLYPLFPTYLCHGGSTHVQCFNYHKLCNIDIYIERERERAREREREGERMASKYMPHGDFHTKHPRALKGMVIYDRPIALKEDTASTTATLSLVFNVKSHWSAATPPRTCVLPSQHWSLNLIYQFNICRVNLSDA